MDSGFLSEASEPREPRADRVSADLEAARMRMRPLVDRVLVVMRRAHKASVPIDNQLPGLLRQFMDMLGDAAREPDGAGDAATAEACFQRLKKRLQPKAVLPLKRAMLATADVVFCTLCTSGGFWVQSGLLEQRHRMDVLVVDEAGQATEVGTASCITGVLASVLGVWGPGIGDAHVLLIVSSCSRKL